MLRSSLVRRAMRILLPCASTRRRRPGGTTRSWSLRWLLVSSSHTSRRHNCRGVSALAASGSLITDRIFVGAFLVACFLSFLLLLFYAPLFAITGFYYQPVTAVQMIGGYMVPGRPVSLHTTIISKHSR